MYSNRFLYIACTVSSGWFDSSINNWKGKYDSSEVNKATTVTVLPELTTHSQTFASRLPTLSGLIFGGGGLAPVEVSPVVSRQANAKDMKYTPIVTLNVHLNVHQNVHILSEKGAKDNSDDQRGLIMFVYETVNILCCKKWVMFKNINSIYWFNINFNTLWFDLCFLQALHCAYMLSFNNYKLSEVYVWWNDIKNIRHWI